VTPSTHHGPAATVAARLGYVTPDGRLPVGFDEFLIGPQSRRFRACRE
jgi:hypothetical protein